MPSKDYLMLRGCEQSRCHPRRSRTPCSSCFIRSRSGIANSSNDNPAPAQGADARKDVLCFYGNLMVVITTNQDRRQKAARFPTGSLRPGAGGSRYRAASAGQARGLACCIN